MSIRRLLLGAALALTVTGALAAENPNSANFVMPGCRNAVSEQYGFLEGYCTGIVVGIIGIGGAPGACLAVPDAVTSSQAVRVVIVYIDARPARMHEHFTELALEALRAAWPCRK
jgi:hypothetical protein